MNTIFRFKQFEIDQRGSAMKINTDGVLLGSLTQFATSPQRILDIGTGTGVIALMLAQRYPNAHIDAVEIDSEAAQCADRNFKKSAFADRLRVFDGTFENMLDKGPYDWIISNPPFYTNSLHNPDIRMRQAKHTDFAFFQRLITFAEEILSDQGELHLILPTDLASEIRDLAREIGMRQRQIISIRSYPHSEIIRQIICLRKGNQQTPLQTMFTIYEQPQQYSKAYCESLKPFFLAF